MTDDRLPSSLEIDDLGLDTTVKVRKRRPIAKLDEDLLLSGKGIPYLRQQIVPKMRFKGRGYERDDMRNLLHTYKVWSYRLFPKANFEQILHTLQKLGSTRSISSKRASWLMETREERDGPIRPDSANDNVGRMDSEHSVGTEMTPIDIDEEIITDVNNTNRHDSSDSERRRTRPGSRTESLFMSDYEDEDVILADGRPTQTSNNDNNNSNRTRSNNSLFVSDNEDEEDNGFGAQRVNKEANNSDRSQRRLNAMFASDNDDDVQVPVIEQDASEKSDPNNGVPDDNEIDALIGEDINFDDEERLLEEFDL